jgi:hypothetical protein
MMPLVFLFVCFCLGLAAEEVAPMGAIQAAEKGIAEFPPAVPGQTGLVNAKLQTGFQVYTASPAELMKSSHIGSIIIPTGVWRFVVVSNEQPAALITVQQVNGQWTAVSMGGATLAVEISKIMEKWPKADGYTHRFVRIYQARADFVEISRASDEHEPGFVPLSSSRVALGITGQFDPQTVMYNSEFITSLKEIVDNNVKTFIGYEQK